MDSGANCNAVSRKIVKILGLIIRQVILGLGSFGREKKPQQTELTSFTIKSLDGKTSISIENAVVNEFLTTDSEIPPTNEAIKKFKHLNDINITELEDKSIGLLLSAKVFAEILKKGLRIGKEGEPTGILTKFGWCFMGSLPGLDENEKNICSLNEKEIMDIDYLLRRMYRHDFINRDEQEFPPEMQHPSQFDEYSLSQMLESIIFNTITGRYQVALPWRYGRQQTAEIFKNIDFYTYCINRTKKLKEKLNKMPDMKEKAFSQMQDLIDKNYAEIIPDHSAPEGAPICYLANHLVTHDDKPDKLRVTQDAAARVQGHCLNDYLLDGPDLMNKMSSIMIRFRRHPVVLTADIKDFFYRIELHPMDRAAVRIIWWTSTEMNKEQLVQGLAHLFGLRSSPAVATMTLRFHGQQIKDQFEPYVYSAIMDSFYVDDYTDSLRTVQLAKDMKENLTEALSLGGFQLCKWRSNVKHLSDPPQVTTEPEVTSDAKAEPKSHDARWRKAARCIDGGDEEAEDKDEENDDENLTSEKIQDLFTDQVGNISQILSDVRNEKILGVGYCYDTDVLYVRVGKLLDREVSTKKQALSWLATIYDPLGLVAPYTLKGRIIFQEINESGINWKDPIPKEILKKFNKWKSTVGLLKELKIRRWTATPELTNKRSQLIIFCDASITGYGCVAYIRRHDENEQNICVTFLLSKSHVVPLKMMRDPLPKQEEHCESVPKLELEGAKLCATVRDSVVRESNETYDDIILFTDSTTVLNWISDWKRKFRTFENFRLKKIRMLSSVNEWRYCPTDCNPADYSSKGLAGNEQEKWAKFHNGPTFLLQAMRDWPTAPEPKKVAEETPMTSIASIAMVAPVELCAIGGTISEPEVTLDRSGILPKPWPMMITDKLGVWSTKVRTIARFKKFLLLSRPRGTDHPSTAELLNKNRNYNLRPRRSQNQNDELNGTENTKKHCLSLTLNDLEGAEKLLVKALQSCHFEKEIVTSMKLGIFTPTSYNELKNKKSKLIALSPFLDSEGILRVGGRLGKASTLPYDYRHPIIIPDVTNELTKALVNHYHHKNLHCSATETFYILRMKYFLLGGREGVRKVVGRCVPCQKTSKRPEIQKMGDLPESRLQMAAPFAVSGLDVFGDFDVTHSARGTRKRWVLLCTCLTTRAVALYPLKNMDLSTVVRALVKMNSQYPALRKIVSDRGSNFVGANREMKTAFQTWKNENIAEALATEGLEWVFGPAATPHYGGVWERLVAIAKNSLKACLNGKVVDEDTFDALCYGIAGIMNRRPLTRANNSTDEMMVLSPSHFIYPYKYNNSIHSIVPPVTEAADYLRASWTEMRLLLDDYWKLWLKQYVQLLTKREKWQTSSKSHAVGDVVLIVENITPRERWRLATIKEVLSDGNHKRQYKLVDAYKNEFIRHHNGIVKLELDY